MSAPSDLEILTKLEQIGGDVEACELAYQLGHDSVFGAWQLAEQGLVSTRTYFSLTDSGRELITSPSPEGSLDALSSTESLAGTPAPDPGGAGDDLPPTGFAACHGRAA